MSFFQNGLGDATSNLGNIFLDNITNNIPAETGNWRCTGWFFTGPPLKISKCQIT